MKKISRLSAPFALLASLLAPLLAAAAAQTGYSGINVNAVAPYSSGITNLINYYLVPVLIAIAFIVFLWGIYKYFILGAANESEKAEGRKFALWGVIGFVIILSLWGIVNLVMSTFGLSVGQAPPFPTIGNYSGTAGNTTGNSIFSGVAPPVGGGGTVTTNNTGSSGVTAAQDVYNACMAQAGSTDAQCQAIQQQFIQDNGGTGGTVTSAQSAYNACMAQAGSTATECDGIYNQYVLDNQSGSTGPAGGSGTAPGPNGSCPSGQVYDSDTATCMNSIAPTTVTCSDGSQAVDAASCPPTSSTGTCYDDNGNPYPC